MVNKIWGAFIIIGITFFIITNQTETLNKVILESASNSLELIIKIFPVMALWLGIMNIATESGLLSKLSKKISKLLKLIFKDIKEDDESLGFIASNIICNMFGLGNAATPFGLKAMQSLQKNNPKKDTATKDMITFLVLNTSGVTIIPTTIIALRMMYGSINPTKIVLPCILASSITTISALLINNYVSKRN